MSELTFWNPETSPLDYVNATQGIAGIPMEVVLETIELNDAFITRNVQLTSDAEQLVPPRQIYNTMLRLFAKKSLSAPTHFMMNIELIEDPSGILTVHAYNRGASHAAVGIYRYLPSTYDRGGRGDVPCVTRQAASKKLITNPYKRSWHEHKDADHRRTQASAPMYRIRSGQPINPLSI